MARESAAFDPKQLDSLRDRLRESAEAINFDNEVSEFLQNKRINQLPFSTMPEELIGVMEIIVPAEGDRANDTSVSVRSSKELLELYAYVFQPNFHATQISALTPYQLGTFMHYANAHYAYLAEQTGIVANQLAVAKRRLTWAQNHLRVELVKLGVKSHLANLLTNTDPYIEELQFGVDSLTALHLRYSTATKNLETVVNGASRDITRRQGDPDARGFAGHRQPGQNTPPPRPDVARLLSRY